MAALADLYKKNMSMTNQFFPNERPVRPYGNPVGTQQLGSAQSGAIQEMAMPDMGAARSRSSSTLGALLPLIGLGLAFGRGNRAGGNFARGLSQAMQANQRNQTALEVWKANQINAQRQAQQEQLLAEQERQREMAMEMLKMNRGRIDQVLELDDSLLLDPQVNEKYLAGDYDGFVDYLASIGWKKPETPQSNEYIYKNIGGNLVAINKDTLEVAKDYGRAGAPPTPADEGPKPLTRADRDSITRNVTGGYTLDGTLLNGWAKQYKNPEALMDKLYRQYSWHPDALQYAIEIAFGDPKYTEHYNWYQQKKGGSVPLTGEQADEEILIYDPSTGRFTKSQ